MGILGTAAEGAECVGRVGVSTLRDAAAGDFLFIGICSTFFSCVISVNNVFLTGSLAARLGVVVDGGRASILMMSPASYFTWSVNFTSGNGVDVRKM